MKIKQRALALLLSAVMVLTFMPAMAFADAGQNTKKATSLKYIGSLEYDGGGVDSDGESYGPYFSGWDEPGNKVIITWDDKSTSTFVCKEYPMTNLDGSAATAVGYFPEDVEPHVVPREDGGTDADNDVYIGREVGDDGTITITYEYPWDYTDSDGYTDTDWLEISGTVKGVKVDSLKYVGSALTYEPWETPQNVSPWQKGAKITVGYSDGSTKTAVCKEWKTKVDGEEVASWDYFFEGEEPKIVYDKEDGYPYATNALYFDFDYEHATEAGIQFEYKGVKGTAPVTKGAWEMEAPDKVWAGENFWPYVQNADITSLSTSNKAVIAVKKSYYYDENNVKHPDNFLNAKKAGKATITANVKADNGVTGTVKKTITVKKYPNQIKSLKVDGKTVKISKNKYAYQKKIGKSKKSIKIKMALKKGWKISSVVGSQYNNNKSVKMKVTKKMLTKGSAISFGKKYNNCMIQVVFKKGKDTIHYNFYFYR